MRKDCNKVITLIDALGHLLSPIIGLSPGYSQNIKSTDTYALLCSMALLVVTSGSNSTR